MANNKMTENNKVKHFIKGTLECSALPGEKATNTNSAGRCSRFQELFKAQREEKQKSPTVACPLLNRMFEADRAEKQRGISLQATSPFTSTSRGYWDGEIPKEDFCHLVNRDVRKELGILTITDIIKPPEIWFTFPDDAPAEKTNKSDDKAPDSGKVLPTASTPPSAILSPSPSTDSLFI